MTVDYKDYESFKNVIEIFTRPQMFEITITFSDGQEAEHQSINIMKALEYVAEQAGKMFTQGIQVEKVEIEAIHEEK